MASSDLGLPFERGNTYSDGGLVTMTSSTAEHLLGKVFQTTDSNGELLKLRCVRADAALTDVGGKTVSYTSGKIGKNVDALCNSTGEVSSVIDDEYATKDITQYDIFYVVEEGDVVAKAETDLDADDAIMAHASDTVAQATAGSYVIGVANEADGTTTSGYASIHVCGGLKPSDPAS
jgi:hypothetical protein